MSMRPLPASAVPDSTARVAQAAFPRGCLAMRIRDEFGPVFQNADFVEAFAPRGGPAVGPGVLALVSVLQYAERLTDRQAADAVRSRIDWKYCLVRHEALLFRARVRGPCRWSVAAGW